MPPEPPAPGGGPAVGAPGPIQQPGAPTGPLPQFSLAMDGAVAPAPVLGIAPAVTADPRRVACGRCGGANATGMAFCQYCGAPLGDPAVATSAPLAPVVSPVPSLVVFPCAAGPAGSPGAASAAESPPGAGAWPAAPLGAPPGPVAFDGPTAPPPPLVPPGPPSPAPDLGSVQATPGQEPLRARLVVIGQDGTPGREYPLVADQIDLGREEGDIRLPNDPYVSPRHARIRRRDGRFSIQDLDSTNGVFLRIRRPEPIQNGDLLLVGLEVLRFETVTDADRGLGAATERGTRVFGSPAAPRHARLVQRTVEGTARDVFYVTRDELTIGREQGDVVFTTDAFMSRRHATIRRDPATSTFEIRDLGSSNGTYLAIRGEIPLQAGDHVRIGQHLFRLDVDRRQ